MSANNSKKRTIDKVDGGLSSSPANNKIFIETGNDQETAQATLVDDRLIGPNRDFAVTMYFKALDRYPGGNADMYLMKYILTVYHKWILLEKINRCNWDGENYKSKYLFPVEIPHKELETFTTNVVNAFIQLNKDPEVEENGGDMEYEMIDPRNDREEEDTKWSGLHFNLYLAPKNGYKSKEAKAFANCDTYNLGDCIYKIIDNILGDSWDYEYKWDRYLRVEVFTLYRDRPYGPLPKISFPISSDANKVIKACKALCGITTVLDYANNVSRSAKDDKNEKSVQMDVDDDDTYEMPDELTLGKDYELNLD
eukprot:242388_1